jgi:hypothetical protein
MHINMTEETKIDRYKGGLKEAIKDALVPVFPCPTTFKEWEHLIPAIDNNIFQRNNEKKHGAQHNHTPTVLNCTLLTSSATSSSSSSTEVVPMDIDAVRTGGTPRGNLASEERQARLKNNLCPYCGKPGHVVNDCFKRKAKHGDKSGKATPKTN